MRCEGLLAAAAALALVGCIDVARVLAESGSVEKRRAAAKQLGRRRDPDSTPCLIAALEDPEEPVREKVAWALGQIATADAIDALSRSLADPAVSVRSQAALGLGRGGAAVAGRLVKALADPEPEVRASAATALGEVRGPVAALGLRQAVVDSVPRVRAAALAALVCAEEEGAAAELQAALSDESGEVRLAAAKALATQPDASSVTSLTGALEDDNVGVTVFAAKALVQMPTREAVPGLERVARTFHGELRDEAFGALGRTEGDAARTALEEFLGHEDAGPRSLAVRALGSGLHEGSQAALVRALADPDADVCREAAYSLAVYGRDEGVSIITEDLLAGPRRREAIDSLARIGPSAAEAVRGLIEDPASGTAADTAAIIALASMGSPDSLSVEAISRALADPRAETRATAAMAIGEIGAAEALDEILNLVSDKDQRVRMMAAYAAARLGRDSHLDELGAALREGSEPTRRMAARLLAGLADGRLRTARSGGLDVDASVRPLARQLLAGLEAPHGAVRALSAVGLGLRGLADAEVVSALESRDLDVDWRVRAAAAEALGRIGTPGSVKALATFVRDREFEVRLAACRALCGTPERNGVPVAASALIDPRREVRAAALAALQDLSGQSFGLAPGRTPSTDELESAVRRAQIWWNEHERDYAPAAP